MALFEDPAVRPILAEQSASAAEALDYERADDKHDCCVSVIGVLGVIEIRAERIGRDTSYRKIIEAVERAERSRARCAERSAVPAPVAMPA
jgi:hypothetical protein